VWPVLQQPDPPVKALAHITGGGLLENLPRVLPSELGIKLRGDSWPVPALYALIQQRGGIQEEEMYRVFNMGVGMVALADPSCANTFQGRLPVESWIIGEVVANGGEIILV
jgi:phosphoribosylformylglycinamidine cyclo-ligase